MLRLGFESRHKSAELSACVRVQAETFSALCFHHEEQQTVTRP